MSGQEEVRAAAVSGLVEAAGAADEPPAASWRIVWCHERCHKDDRQQLRGDLQEAALAAGSALVCFKKAKQFGSWLHRSDPVPFILLTDWREVKPCMDSWWQLGAGSKPSFTVVVVEDPKHFGKVAAWAAGLKWDAVRIVKGFDDVCALVASMVDCLPNYCAPVHVSLVPAACKASDVGSRASWMAGEVGAAEEEGETPRGAAIGVAPQGAITWAGAGQPFVVAQAASLAAPVAAVLASICPSHTSEQLWSLLTAQVPDHYDD